MEELVCFQRSSCWGSCALVAFSKRGSLSSHIQSSCHQSVHKVYKYSASNVTYCLVSSRPVVCRHYPANLVPMFHPYQRPGIEPPRHYSATKSTLQRYEESDDSESLYSGASTSTTTHLPPKRKRTRLYPSSYKSGASSGKRPTTKTALSKLRPTDKSTTLGTDHTNKQYYSQSTTSTSGSMERLLEGPTTSTYTVAGQQVTNPSNRQLLVTSSSAAVSTRLRMGYDSTTTHHATRPPQMTMVNNVLSRQLVPTPQWADAAMSNSQVTPICFAVRVRISLTFSLYLLSFLKH